MTELIPFVHECTPHNRIIVLKKNMKAAYIISTLFYRISLLATIFAIVLGVIFVTIADDPMPVLKVTASVAVVGGILSAVFNVVVKRTKQSILENMA